jgi:hypothetical protein
VWFERNKFFLTDSVEFVQDSNTHYTRMDPDEGELALSAYNSILTHNTVRDVIGPEP